MIEIQEAKKRKPKGVQYFTQDTENAINDYNSTTDFELKDKIYRERIHYAFFKLTENIIHTFKFYYTEVDNNTKNYKKRVDKAPIEEIESNEDFSYRIDEGSSQDRLSNFLDEYVVYCTSNIYTLFPKEADAQIADAILELFRKREHIDIFNKKALYIYIREIIDAKTPKITKIADRLYNIFKQHYYFYLENGYTNF